MIKFNEVTWYSKLAAALFLLFAFPALMFYMGMKYQEAFQPYEVLVPAPAGPGSNDGAGQQAATTTDTASSATLQERTSQVLAALKAKDVRALAALVDPGRGVKLNAGVSLGGTMSRDAMVAALESGKKMLWGYADGSGLAVEQTVTEFIGRFWQRDFSLAPQISSATILRGGSASPNLFMQEFTGGESYVSYHYPYTTTYVDETGKTVPQPNSWQTLNVVFAKAQDGTWYLVGLQQDQWGI